ncbi:MAG: pantetheine-phosphate adenylyltransferase [Thaumarchaeota archaeon]|nr:pantetheine-phosphate adenylyltransferase [Nitrososphaerota archaeon]
MSKFRGVAVGGSFDPFHKGHRELLAKAFNIGEKVFVGIVSDNFSKRLGKDLEDTYDGRVRNIKAFIDENFPESKYHIGALDDYVGPIVITDSVDAIVVTEETEGNIETVGRLRAAKRLRPLSIIRIPYVLDDGGQRISSSRIKRLEIDEGGSVIENQR